MTDDLLPYYEKELAYIRALAPEFAKANPKIADRLQLRTEGSEDPHVERLIQAFAFLNAGIRHKLDDDFPELSQAVLQTLYPHFLAPMPSMCIAKLQFAANKSDAPATVQRGAELTLAAREGENCGFRTCYPATVWPINVSEASATAAPFIAPDVVRNAEAVVRIKLQCATDKSKFAQWGGQQIRFYLKAHAQHVYRLYELLFNHVAGIAVASSPRDQNPLVLGAQAIQPVGFDRDEGILPYSSRSFLGYRLISEFFCYPQKFLFFDFELPDAAALERFDGTVELYFYLNRFHEDLAPVVNSDTFQLGCTPIVNLFRQIAEPIRLTHQAPQYRIQPSARRPLAIEVYSVDKVTAISPTNEEREFRPFFSVHHATSTRNPTTFWQATRRPSHSAEGVNDRGTEVDLSIVDLNLETVTSPNWTLNVETTCLNRNIPAQMVQSGLQLSLQLEEGVAGIQAECLTAPSSTYRPPLRDGSFWCLISHLSLNHLSLIDSGEGADAIREILRLYDFVKSDATRDLIDGIRSVTSRRVVGRVGGGLTAGFCRGVEVSIDFDTENHFRSLSPYLLACVLEHFLGLYCSINSFSQMVATTNHRNKVLKKWQPRAGERTLL